mmetsp:Transcript_13577/g.29876  ORF Transcript_13577/g.29876 Transcript_13577/m.29876 type:complete len:245 (+) Transcript_13577:401-1135(+)
MPSGDTDLVQLLRIPQPLECREGLGSHGLCLLLVGNLPVMPHHRGLLLLDVALRHGFHEKIHCGTHPLLPIGVVQVQRIQVVQKFPSFCPGTVDLKAMFCDEREAAQLAKTAFQKPRVSSTNNVRNQVRPRIDGLQEFLELRCRRRHLWPSLELAQSTIVVKEEGPLSCSSRPKLPRHDVQGCQNPCGPRSERFSHQKTLIGVALGGEFDAALDKVLSHIRQLRFRLLRHGRPGIHRRAVDGSL